MRSDAWAGALSWCNNQVWFSHNSGLFLRTLSLKHAKTSPGTTVYHLTSWYKFMINNAFPIKKHNQHHLDLSLTDWSVLFLVEETFTQSSPYVWLSNWNVSVNFLPSLQQNFTYTGRSSSSFIATLSLIRRTACARARFSGCSSKTNAHSETGQIAVCCQNLTLGALSSRSARSMLFGALFKRFSLFLNKPCMY